MKMPFEETWTSRRALLLGMTNTDQVGMQQARAPAARQVGTVAAEELPDVGDDGNDIGGEDGDVNPETGLTAEQESEFERMRTGEAPAGDDVDADPQNDNDESGAGDDDTNQPEPPPAPPLGREKTPAELAAEALTGKKSTPKTVNWNKYQRDLKRAQDAAALATQQATKEREDRIKLSERVSIINEALAAQAAQPAPAVVDPNAPPENPFEEADIDPNDDYAASVQQLQRRQRYQHEQHSGIASEMLESREDQQMRETFTRDFQHYAVAVDTNLPAAYQFLKDARLTQIFLSEFDKDPTDDNEIFTPAEIQRGVQLFNAEEKWLVGNAIKQRKSPAAAIMKQARVYGFKPAPAAEATPPSAPPRGQRPAVPAARTPAVPTNGVRPPVARTPVAPAAPSAAELLAQQQLDMENGKSLSDGGGAPPQGLTADMLLRLDDDEFAELIDQLAPHQLNALLGK
jgi:hypothetical protein